MPLSAVELFSVGIGPSSSHTAGPVRGDGEHHVSPDEVIRTVRDTVADVSATYEGASRGGLAVNVIEC